MDPFSAFSFACNILHAVELGCKVLVGTVERYKATAGLTAEHQELHRTCVTIDDLSASLEKSLPDPTKPDQLTQSERRLLDASRRCAVLSEDFKLLLDRVEITSNKSIVKTFNVTVKAFWLKDKIDALQKSLTDARDNLTVALLFYMQSQQATAFAQTQEDIASTSGNSERAIINAVKSYSESVSGELQKLTDELRKNSIISNQQNFSSTISEHADMITKITRRLEAIGLSQESLAPIQTVNQDVMSQPKLLDSLFFPQMFHRFQQVADAEYETYHWMLRPSQREDRHWSCFTTWLHSKDVGTGLYWIHGKPGSGKSTLLKFLYSRLVRGSYAATWCAGQSLYSAHYFCWNNGELMQKSLPGFCRSMLFQLLKQNRELVSKVTLSHEDGHLSQNYEKIARWTNAELCMALREIVEILSISGHVLIIVDGLDELVGDEEEQEHILELLLHLGQTPNIRLIISSRPWNLFQDAFGHLHQLQLENLTHHDITLYVTSKLCTRPRWRELCRYSPGQTQRLISSITVKAAGVFLWVRLVVRSLMESLRDGDDILQLEQKVAETPAELERYFTIIFESIEPAYRQEASMLLQVAMHEETRFVTVSSFSLLEASFIGKLEGIAWASNPDLANLDFSDGSSIRLRLDGALRKLNSRCKGLLECTTRFDDLTPDEFDSAPYKNLGSLSDADGLTTKEASTGESFGVVSLDNILTLRVDLIHRSLREFLLLPQPQKFLSDHTRNSFDVRQFLCYARLVQIKALLDVPDGTPHAVRFASYLLSTLSTAHSLTQLTFLTEYLPNQITRLSKKYVWDEESVLFISPSLQFWGLEHSTFMTLAIDFGIVTYVLDNLNAEVIKRKTGRPLLDYILRPRFATFHSSWHYIGNRIPDIDMIRAVLRHGADPNELHNVYGTSASVSVWALFLCFVADWAREEPLEPDVRKPLLDILKVLIDAGADLFLPMSYLCISDTYEWMYASDWHEADLSPGKTRLFAQRWGHALEIRSNNFDSQSDPLYAVSSLVSSFGILESAEGRNLISEIQAKEQRHIQVLTPS